ncbi:hypothetical protein PHYSODRAFT_324491 [Phytophthora sojae]|uniref:Uncharacterized protein n=1 Tax=Phytophthora sojae (strain P6497) TaxID=1094619 RepID=G4YYB3_PHYSP|nr:hypothetical protein PHYSODRAFT_324491 [Phytophthora sojae]EGZ23264.1 hypothetical protein PHYSODRAFT_324491 [Phytophthora sojae]|eukprot:XP_009518552.1 hypothetical protein PHYSODRAFT_324491 [Phytophthora sojae]
MPTHYASQVAIALRPWDNAGSTYVCESTGAFTTTEKVHAHFEGGELGATVINDQFGTEWVLLVVLLVLEGLGTSDENEEEGPLEEADLPASSCAERLTLGNEDTVIVGVEAPIVEIVAKMKDGQGVKYLTMASSYEVFWLPREAVMPEYASLVTAFEQADRRKKGLPELRRSARLADANAQVDDDFLLLA